MRVNQQTPRNEYAANIALAQGCLDARRMRNERRHTRPVPMPAYTITAFVLAHMNKITAGTVAAILARALFNAL